MTTLALNFDTYKLISTLQAKGFSKDQAEVLVDTVQRLDLSGIATKADLQHLEQRSEARLDTRFAKAQLNIITMLMGAMVAQGALVIAILQLLR